MAYKLFLSTKPGEDEFYARIRDDERRKDFRQQLEKMWEEFQPYAPRGFQKNLQYQFHQRWWEMYVTLGLCNLGLPVRKSRTDAGPDVCLDFEDIKVWIEMIAPNVGTTNDAVPIPIVNGVGDLPMRKCLLRLTQAVTDKQIILDNYIQQGIVSEEDAFIIAVSSCALNQFGGLLDHPQPVMLRVLAGAGNLAIPVNKNSENYSKYLGKIYRDKGSQVDIALFYSNEFDSVAGILYSKHDPLNAPIKPEESFELYLNPNSKVEIPMSITEKVTTWSEKCSDKQSCVWEMTQTLRGADA